MSENYPMPVETLTQTLDQLLSHLGDESLAEFLRQAKASIDWETNDAWNGGTDYYVLNLRVPVVAFAGIDSRREAVEKLLLQKVQEITRQFDRDRIGKLVIVPDARLTGTLGAGQLSPAILDRIWERDGLRLFLTHRAQEKAGAAGLKTKLVPYGVSAFVAHEDIEPNQVWQNEIERALASMHALVALSTPGFDTSVWCQQEIGFALGRGVPVIPLRLGNDPHGFIARIQALTGDLANTETLAGNVIDLLLKYDRTAALMREYLVRKFERVTSWEDARLLKTRLVSITHFDEGQLSRLEKALTMNEKVSSAWGVPEPIKQMVPKHRNPTSPSA